MKNVELLIEYLEQNKIQFKENESLAPYTTWKVGGPAKLLIEINEIEKIIKIIKKCNELGIAKYIIGGGSNILVSDEGFDGVVIKNSLIGIEISNESGTERIENRELKDVRLSQYDTKEYYSFSELDYDESDKPRINVSVYSGTLLSLTINSLINKGITGLQWFAGIPGTIGGAVFNNIHGGSHFLSEYVLGIDVIDDEGQLEHIEHDELGFGYDHSKLQLERKFIVKAYFELFRGDKLNAQKTAIAWARAKSEKQPYNSAGCSFKNITVIQMQEKKFPSNSWGYIIDKILNLKALKIGEAQISSKHAAFIETFPGATAEDVMQLLEQIYEEADKKINITPKTEIFFLGFPKDRIEKFL